MDPDDRLIITSLEAQGLAGTGQEGFFMLSAIQNASSAINQFGKGFANSARNLNQAMQSAGNEPVRTVEQTEPVGSTEVELHQDEAAPLHNGTQRIANAPPEVEREAVNTIMQKNGIHANIAVIKRIDKTVGSLLDVIG